MGENTIVRSQRLFKGMVHCMAMFLCLGVLVSCGGTSRKEAEQALKNLSLWEPSEYLSWDKRSEQSGSYVFTNVEVKTPNPLEYIKIETLTVQNPHMDKDQPLIDRFSLDNVSFYEKETVIASFGTVWLDKPNAVMAKAFSTFLSSGGSKKSDGELKLSEFSFIEMEIKALEVFIRDVTEGEDKGKNFLAYQPKIELDHALIKGAQGDRIELMDLKGFSLKRGIKEQEGKFDIAASFESFVMKGLSKSFYNFSGQEDFVPFILSPALRFDPDATSKHAAIAMPYEDFTLKNMDLELSGMLMAHLEQMDGRYVLEKDMLREIQNVRNFKVTPDSRGTEGIAFLMALNTLGYKELVFQLASQMSYDLGKGEFSLDSFDVDLDNGFSLDLALLLTGIDYAALREALLHDAESEEQAKAIFKDLLEKVRFKQAQLVYQDKSFLEKLLNMGRLFFGTQMLTDEAMKSTLDGMASEMRSDLVPVLGEENFKALLMSLKTFIENKYSLNINFKVDPPLTLDELEAGFQAEKAVLSVEAGEKPAIQQ